MNPDPHGRAASRRCASFTLIELLTVMAIIIAMGAITLGSYFAIMRGAALKAAVGHLRSTFWMARQRAVLENRLTYVIFDRDTVDTNMMYYSVVTQKGTVTYRNGLFIADEYGDFSTMSAGSPIYNMGTLQKTTITAVVQPDKPVDLDGDGDADVQLPCWGAFLASGILGVGSRYGFDAAPPNMLPRGFSFGQGTPAVPNPRYVAFGSDGILRDLAGNIQSQDLDIRLYEELNKARIVTVHVDAPAGMITIRFP